MAEDYITRNRCNRPEKLRMRRRILSGNREIPDFGENPLAMVLPGALDFARVDVGHHVGVAQRLGKLPLEVVRHPVGVLQEVLAADDDVEGHGLLRASGGRGGGERPPPGGASRSPPPPSGFARRCTRRRRPTGPSRRAPCPPSAGRSRRAAGGSLPRRSISPSGRRPPT